MNNDASKIQNDLRSMITVIAPEIDTDMLEIRLEEILYRYNIQQRAATELENDLAEKLQLFISSKRLEGLSERTLYDYDKEMRLFMRHNTKAAVQIQTPDIRLYLASLQEVENSTIGKKLTVLKSFFGWMVKEEILLRDPTAKIKLPKKKKRLPKGLTVQELELAREKCETKRQRAILEVFYSTGCRLSELVSMNISQINKQDMSTTVVGKGNAERKVFLNFLALYHLENYLETRDDEDDALFVSERRPHGRIKNRAIADEIDKIEKRCNFNKKLTPHTMRHSLAQAMLDNGASLEEVQHILGHANIGTTQVYTNISEERKQQAHKRFA